MEKKKIFSGKKPDGIQNKSYEMNGSHTYGTSSNAAQHKDPEEMTDRYDRDETCNAQYNKKEKNQ